jgi:hypothetical protein
MSAFNGLSHTEIERRCRPLLFVSDSPQYDCDEQVQHADESEYVELLRSMRSRCGFLAFGESLIDCIESDRALCAALNVSSAELLARLRSVLDRFELAVSRTAASDSVRSSIVTQQVALDDRVSLVVTRIESRGFQRSPFVNLDSDSPDSVWNVEYHILNQSLAPGNVTLKIGGSLRFGALEFIERYGFFGGGGGAAALRAVQAGHAPLRNDYRLDPALTLAVLTGQWNAEGRAAYAQQLRVERLALEPQIAAAATDANRCADAVRQGRAALQAARATGDAEAIETAEVELDEATGESLFAQQTLDFLQRVQLAQIDEHLSEFERII